MTKRYFRVKYGYSAQDQVSIEEKDLERAIYARIKGLPIQLGNSFVNGGNIIAIVPHWHKHTGWYDWYEPTNGDDWKQIKRDCPDYDGVVEAYKDRVYKLISEGKTNLIGKSEGLIKLSEKANKNESFGEVKSIGNILKK